MIEKSMKKIPKFAPYFELLKIITFSASYACTLAQIGRLPKL